MIATTLRRVVSIALTAVALGLTPQSSATHRQVGSGRASPPRLAGAQAHQAKGQPRYQRVAPHLSRISLRQNSGEHKWRYSDRRAEIGSCDSRLTRIV